MSQLEYENIGVGNIQTPVIIPIQQRFLDYGSRINATNINRLLEVVVGARGKRKVYGLEVSTLNTNTLKITKGVVVKDFVMVKLMEDVSITVPFFTGTCYLVLRYRYLESLPQDDVDILFVLPGVYDSNNSLYLYLSTVSVENGEISNCYYDNNIEPFDVSSGTLTEVDGGIW